MNKTKQKSRIQWIHLLVGIGKTFTMALGIITMCYLMIGLFVVRFSKPRSIVTSNKPVLSQKVTPTLFTLQTPPPRATYKIPQANTWVEYTSRCIPLSTTIRIFIPTAWRLSSFGEQPVYDNAETDTACQILLGYPEDPGSYQARGPKEIYGSLSIQSMIINKKEGQGTTLSWWKNYYNNDNGYKEEYDIDAIIDRVVNGKPWLQMYRYSRKIEEWTTVHNGYLVSVQIHNVFPNANPLLKGYIQKTGEEVISKLLFR